MKTSKKILYLNLAAILIFFFVSWTRHTKSSNATTSTQSAYDYFFSNSTGNINSLSGDNNIPDEFDWVYNNSKLKKVPPADDVMVQRIPGDNTHLLVMAVYAYAAYHEIFVKINYGGEDIFLRDDGNEYDKVAGDGIYTTKIFTDVKEFRKQAVEMLKETIKNKWQPLFVDREFKASTVCDVNPFSETSFDNNEPVSIANLASAGETVQIGKVRQNSIFLTDLSIVEDPARTWNFCTQTGNINGAWTFKTLMKNLATQIPSQPASDQTVSDFVKGWLNSWSIQKIINSDTVAARTLVHDKILDPWLNKSKAAGNPQGFLDMRFAPFKLTAIVNRFDLRERASGIPAGEGRMIFCLINSDCTKAEDFTLIFEYGINKPDVCDSLRNWATQWYNLKDLTLGSAEYLAALQKITDQFTLCGTNTKKTNQSSIDAVRTGERALANSDANHPPRWEFREFGLNPNSHVLAERTISQAPADKYNVQVENSDVIRMVKFINDNSADINAESYEVPAIFDSVPFLAGKSTILDTPVGLPTKPYHWDGVENNKSAAFINTTITRHVFSRNVCSGCHSGETQTFFTHVDPVFFGTSATLSGFLAGKAGRGGAIDSDGDSTNDKFKVKDAANRGSTTTDRFHTFSDIKRRAIDLKQVATTVCATVFSLRNDLMFHPVGAVH